MWFIMKIKKKDRILTVTWKQGHHAERTPNNLLYENTHQGLSCCLKVYVYWNNRWYLWYSVKFIAGKYDIWDLGFAIKIGHTAKMFTGLYPLLVHGLFVDSHISLTDKLSTYKYILFNLRVSNSKMLSKPSAFVCTCRK